MKLLYIAIFVAQVFAYRDNNEQTFHYLSNKEANTATILKYLLDDAYDKHAQPRAQLKRPTIVTLNAQFQSFSPDLTKNVPLFVKSVLAQFVSGSLRAFYVERHMDR